jgi:hypothetical protein
MKTNIDFIDENLTAEDFTNKITLVNSRVGLGKTTLLCKIASNVSKQDNQKIIYITSETPSKLIIRKIITDYANIPLDKISENKYNIRENINEIVNLKGKKSSFIIKQANKLSFEFLKEHINENLIIIDLVLNPEELNQLKEFKKDFAGTILVSSQLKESPEEPITKFNEEFNHIIIERDLILPSRRIVIATVDKVFRCDVEFDTNTLNIRKK